MTATTKVAGGRPSSAASAGTQRGDDPGTRDRLRRAIQRQPGPDTSILGGHDDAETGPCVAIPAIFSPRIAALRGVRTVICRNSPAELSATCPDAQINSPRRNSRARTRISWSSARINALRVNSRAQTPNPGPGRPGSPSPPTRVPARLTLSRSQQHESSTGSNTHASHRPNSYRSTFVKRRGRDSNPRRRFPPLLA